METNTVPSESKMPQQLQAQHHWLQKLVGEWHYETEATMGADQPLEKATGTETVRSIGGLWVVAEGQGAMPGCDDTATTIMTLGYDPQKQHYVGTWIGSMMNLLWLYEGELNATETMLTLNSEGPAMTGVDKTAQYRDVIEFKDDDHREMTSHVLGEDGQWHHFMTVSYWRT